MDGRRNKGKDGTTHQGSGEEAGPRCAAPPPGGGVEGARAAATPAEGASPRPHLAADTPEAGRPGGSCCRPPPRQVQASRPCPRGVTARGPRHASRHRGAGPVPVEPSLRAALGDPSQVSTQGRPARSLGHATFPLYSRGPVQGPTAAHSRGCFPPWVFSRMHLLCAAHDPAGIRFAASRVSPAPASQRPTRDSWSESPTMPGREATRRRWWLEGGAGQPGPRPLLVRGAPSSLVAPRRTLPGGARRTRPPPHRPSGRGQCAPRHRQEG